MEGQLGCQGGLTGLGLALSAEWTVCKNRKGGKGDSPPPQEPLCDSDGASGTKEERGTSEERRAPCRGRDPGPVLASTDKLGVVSKSLGGSLHPELPTSGFGLF